MSGPLTLLKALLSRQPTLAAGSEFSLGISSGTLANDDCIWKVREVRPYQGIPHALIEQLATGKTKTVAVSAIVSDRTFQPLSNQGRGVRV
jgi:hypothetical protein